MSKISMMSDEEIVNASVKKAAENAKNSKAVRTLKNGSYIVLAALPVAEGILKKGSLSTKAAAALKCGAAVSAAAATIGAVLDLSDRVKNKSENVKDFTEEHPILSSAAEIGCAIAGGAAIVKGGSKILQKASKVFAPAVNSAKTRIAALAKDIDASKLGKHTETIQNLSAGFAQKHPVLSKTAKTALEWAPLAGYVAVAAKSTNECMETTMSETKSNINKLVLLREFAQASLDNGNDDIYA